MTTEDKSIIGQLTPPEVVGLTLFGEIRSGREAAIIAVGSAILNRVKAQRKSWGLTPEEVVLKPYQFSCWNDDPYTSNDETVMVEAQKIIDRAPVGSKTRLCMLIGEAIVKQSLRDTVKGATHYYSPKAMRPINRVPSWAVGLTPTTEVDGHLFFAGVR